MSRVVQEVESYSKTYDGSYENFQKFANELKILLKNKSSIGEYILKGTIEVEKKLRGLENSYKQKGRLVTSLELVHSLGQTYYSPLFTLHVSKRTQRKRTGKGQKEYYDISSTREI